MAPKRDSKGRFVKANDALSDFAAQMANGAGSGAWGGYKDGPLSSYSMDANHQWHDWYGTNWMTRAAVDYIPEDCFKKGYQWVAEADQINLLEDVEKRLKVRAKKKQALAWSRLYGEAYIYMDTGHSPASVLNVERIGQGGLRFINVMRRDDVHKGPIVRDPLSEWYGQPEYYEFRSASRANAVRVHPSRMIRFINGPDPDTGEGTSVLKYMLEPIIAATAARDNVAALTTEARIDIIKACDLASMVSTPEGASQVAARYGHLRQMKATNRMAILDKDGEDWEQRQTSFATLPDVIETMRREVAAAIGIPYSLLFGRPQGLGTNGETELSTYYDNISTMQENDIQPVCDPLDELIIRSALGIRPEEIYIEWLSLWEMSDKEKAEVAKMTADAAKTAIDGGIVSAEMMTEPFVNSMTELGAFQGIEQAYSEWLTGGGWDSEQPEETDVLRPTEEEESDAV